MYLPLNEDGSVDAYFACPGGVGGEWDRIAYRHSADGGETRSQEKIVHTPPRGSIDHFSLCDPGVVYFNGYYYLGYTTAIKVQYEGCTTTIFVKVRDQARTPSIEPVQAHITILYR